MLNTTYEYQRDSDNKTISLTGSVRAYDEETKYKTIYVRTTPNQDADFTTLEVIDFDEMIVVETKTFEYTILDAQQTTANPVDRSGTTPARYGDLEKKEEELRVILDSESVFTDAVEYLWNKHNNTEYFPGT